MGEKKMERQEREKERKRERETGMEDRRIEKRDRSGREREIGR